MTSAHEKVAALLNEVHIDLDTFDNTNRRNSFRARTKPPAPIATVISDLDDDLTIHEGQYK